MIICINVHALEGETYERLLEFIDAMEPVCNIGGECDHPYSPGLPRWYCTHHTDYCSGLHLARGSQWVGMWWTE